MPVTLSAATEIHVGNGGADALDGRAGMTPFLEGQGVTSSRAQRGIDVLWGNGGDDILRVGSSVRAPVRASPSVQTVTR